MGEDVGVLPACPCGPVGHIERFEGFGSAETMRSLGVHVCFDEILRKFASPRIWCRISDPFSTYGSQYVDERPNNKHDFPGHSGEARIHWVFLGVKLSTLVESD